MRKYEKIMIYNIFIYKNTVFCFIIQIIFFCCLTEIIHFGHVVVEDTFESEIRKIFLGGIHHLDHPSVVPV